MNVFIIAAISADGYIGLNQSHRATSWTTTADKKFFVRRTKEAGVVVMGRATFNTFARPLAGRRLIIMTHEPGSIHMEGVEPTNESPAELVARLKHEGVAELAVCGGSSVYTQFMESGLVNEVYLTVMPKFFGEGLPLFTAPQDKKLQLVSSETLEDGNSVLVQYEVV